MGGPESQALERLPEALQVVKYLSDKLFNMITSVEPKLFCISKSFVKSATQAKELMRFFPYLRAESLGKLTKSLNFPSRSRLREWGGERLSYEVVRLGARDDCGLVSPPKLKYFLKMALDFP